MTEPVDTDPLNGYAPLLGVADELMDAQGTVRPVWKRFIATLSSYSAEEIAQRFARGDQYLHDAGVFYRQYETEGSSERDWPLSHVPVLIHENEWTQISEGLIQRAELLEDVVADLYGDNKLVAEGHLPPELIAQNPEWLRPLVGVKPRSGHFLHFVAFELGRGPDGTWWVLGDRTQAPSGAGFALENRVATGRVFSELFAESNVFRLAGFFRTFRDALLALRGGEDSRAAILTPGPLNDTYYEHAYIARYLGMMLLEGEDLTVQNRQVMVRTVSGLMPVSVLWRRLDAVFADPLELNEGSQLGTPGLVNALRAGQLTMVNALGAGVLEARSLLAFLPRIAQALLGEPLKLPNIATWWCGGAAERGHVEANAGTMTIGPALSTRLPFEIDETTALAGVFRGKARDSVSAWLEAEGPALVGQEAVTLSTTPALVEGKLVPRPMSLRAFAVRTPNGWQVMKGGFARIGRTEDATAIAMQRGGSVADVWIVSDRPVKPDTMMPPANGPFKRVSHGMLPARAADNLYWLGRYVERAETIMRLTRAYHVRLAEGGHQDPPLLEVLADELKIYGIEPVAGVPEGLIATLNSAVSSAGEVRDRFSVDGWTALTELARSARDCEAVAPGDGMARTMSALLRRIASFSGLVHENMYRFTGWRFLSIGRSLERAQTMSALLAVFADPDAPEGSLDLAVEVGDSLMTHRRRYALAATRESVVDLLALDDKNPRAVLFHLSDIQNQIGFLPNQGPQGQLTDLGRAVLSLHTEVAVKTPQGLDTEALWDIRAQIADLSNLLTTTYFH